MQNLSKVLELKTVNAVGLSIHGAQQNSISVRKDNVTMELHPAGVIVEGKHGMLLVPYANILCMKCEPEAEAKPQKGGKAA